MGSMGFGLNLNTTGLGLNQGLDVQQTVATLVAAAKAPEQPLIDEENFYSSQESALNNLNDLLSKLQTAVQALQDPLGGLAAQWLNHFYVLARRQIFEGSAQLKADVLRQAAGYFAEVGKMWEEARAMSSRNPASRPSPSPQDLPFRSPQEAAPAMASDMTRTSSPADWRA
jgi:flagellin-specific chaperone FliS